MGLTFEPAPPEEGGGSSWAAAAFRLQPDLTTLVQFDASNAFAGKGKEAPVQDPFAEDLRVGVLSHTVREKLAAEVTLARIRVHHSRELLETAAAGGAGEAGGVPAPAAPVAVPLAEHVRQQLEGFKTAAAAAAAAAAAPPAAASAMDEDTPPKPAAAPTAATFLALAAEQARGRAHERRRNVIATSVAAQQAQAQALLAAPAGGSGGSAGAAAAGPAAPAPVQPRTKPVFAVAYKFHEGFTNAVRRPVRLTDFV